MWKKIRALPVMAPCLLVLLGTPSALEAQGRDLAGDQPLDEATVRAMIDEAVNEALEDAIEDNYSKGVITIGGAELEFGGKLELNLVDTASERSTVLGGPTENPDTHLVFDRLRLEPEIDIGRGISITGQLDFLSDEDSFIKEAVFEWEYDPEWWYEIHAQIGLDDTFIHKGPDARVTESYPLLGDAFWRDEEIAVIWEFTLGHLRGVPVPEVPPEGAGAEYLPRSEFTSSTEHAPFDFANNPGVIRLNLSLGDGQSLDSHSVNKDGADLQRVIHDDRRVEDGLALRHLGAGLTVERDFRELGEIGLQVFYFNDELNDDDINFLQQNLTIFDDLTNAPLSGYGVSGSETKYRYGATLSYHLEAYHFLYESVMDTQPGDGLYLVFQYMEARDGKLERDGWYAQGSYRFSFAQPLLCERYIRYIEPFVRFGELEADIVKIPSLPLTWDREELVFGAVVEVAKHILMKAEYAIHDEKTGGSDVNNDELLVQMLITF